MRHTSVREVSLRGTLHYLELHFLLNSCK